MSITIGTTVDADGTIEVRLPCVLHWECRGSGTEREWVTTWMGYTLAVFRHGRHWRATVEGDVLTRPCGLTGGHESVAFRSRIDAARAAVDKAHCMAAP